VLQLPPCCSTSWAWASRARARSAPSTRTLQAICPQAARAVSPRTWAMCWATGGAGSAGRSPGTEGAVSAEASDDEVIAVGILSSARAGRLTTDAGAASGGWRVASDAAGRVDRASSRRH
jgi:hypothetical protein